MIPNLFSKYPIPKKIPKELQEKIHEFSQWGNREQFIRNAFLYIVGRYGGNRVRFISQFGRIFETDILKIYEARWYMHCTTMNYLIRIMCVKSWLFDEGDIHLRITHTWYIMPHQYLEISLWGDGTLELDPWNYQFGIEYGDHGSGFDSMHIYPIR